MKYRRFGRLNWQVSEIGFGMWGMGGWKDSDDDQSRSSLQLAVDLGCTFFDTAWGYGNGHSEALLGELVRSRPDTKLYTATKIPPMNWKWPSRRGFTLDACFPPDHITEYVKKSLENAGLDSFDLMQFHVWEDAWSEDERWVRALDDLRSEGLIHATGISMNRWEAWNGIRAVMTGHIDAVQVIYNIFDQSPEDELFAACQEMDVAVIARVPFDEGVLTGALTKESTWPEGDWRNTYFVPENLNASVDHAEALRPLVPAGMTMPEMALRFTLSHPAISTIIPGMRKAAHVKANCAASGLGPLSPSLLAELRKHRWVREPTDWSQ